MSKTQLLGITILGPQLPRLLPAFQPQPHSNGEDDITSALSVTNVHYGGDWVNKGHHIIHDIPRNTDRSRYLIPTIL